MALGAGWGILIWLLSLVVGGYAAAAFDPNPEVVSVVKSYILIVFPSLAFQAVLFVITSSFNALHQPMKSLFLSVLRMFVLYVPLALAASAVFGLVGVWWAALFSNVIAAIVGVIWFRASFRKMVIEAPAENGSSSDAAESDAEVAPA
jgi:Na+-driven multidrug efflux pump